MAKKLPTLTYDTGRMLTLAKARDTKRAVARDLSARYQDERERLADVRRRAALARENALHDHGPDKGLALDKAAKLEAEVEGIRARMAELQTEIDVTSGEAAESGRLVASCLAFARSEGLTVPPALLAEATKRTFMPGGVAQ